MRNCVRPAMLSMLVSVSCTLAALAEPASTVPIPWHEKEHFAWIMSPEKVPGEVSMSPEVRAFVESVFQESHLDALPDVLANANAWGSLGPNAPAGPRRPETERPTRVERLRLPSPGQGTGRGTADDPWRGVLSAFLVGLEYESPGIEAYRNYPEPAAIRAYLEQLDYEPRCIVVPAGHYRETTLTVPPGVWLKADGKVVLEPEVPAESGASALVTLEVGAGLEGFVLDGSRIPGFQRRAIPAALSEPPEYRVTAVLAAHKASIVDNCIRNFTFQGIDAAGSRGRGGSHVVAVGNVIENIGYSGISGQSRWLIQDNEIRHCGFLRPSEAGGDDGIIVRWGIETAVVNNLVIGGRADADAAPEADWRYRGENGTAVGRHVISGQSSHRCLVAGNLSIADGATRNNIQFSDGSHENRFVGNLAIATATGGWRIQVGVGANGYGNVIEHNVSILNAQGYGFGAWGVDPDRSPPGYIRNNHAEYRRALIRRPMSWNRYEDNTGRQDHHTVLELTNPEQFGLFGRSGSHDP